MFQLKQVQLYRNNKNQQKLPIYRETKKRFYLKRANKLKLKKKVKIKFFKLILKILINGKIKFLKKQIYLNHQKVSLKFTK